ncbi:Coiled-coil domain-containing protein 124 /Oxs1 [Microdochium nivale]|nr:Coiled-coil domain-containing protein 124 /Oxs1 [Microdochium nivale]
MGGKKAGENSKKVAGQARKAEAAAGKTAVENARKDAAEDSKWNKGSKDDSKKEAEAAKKAEQARKKAELKALEDEEAKSLPDKAPKKNKTAEKKTNRGLDLSQLDDDNKGSALNASGIDNALDALSVTGSSADKIDRHPERRFKAAYAAFEERRLAEMDADGSGAGLRLNQRKDKLRKEFEKSPDNPFNQVSAAYNASKGDVADLKVQEKTKIESRLR